jgi:ferric-dicitrate binding protein FerR (iron transport regulator)
MTDERTDPATDRDDDAELRALLQSAGARPLPPAAVTEGVRAAVAAEWRSVVAARRPQRRVVPWLAAASAAAVAVGAWFALSQPAEPGAVLATVARLDGPAEVRRGSASWETITVGAELRGGDRVRTPATGRLALRRMNGLEVRLDVGTAVALEDDDRARLEAGRVYVDSGPDGARTDRFAVATEFGAVRHLGTQYSVSVARASMAVAVREGNVAIDHGGGHVLASAGESLTVGADGRLERAALAPHDAAWGWAEAAAPAFAIDGRTLDEFLTWAARETGRHLVYASAVAAREAQQTLLQGSVDGLAPEQAIDAVLMTTPALKARVGGAQLRIEQALPQAAP